MTPSEALRHAADLLDRAHDSTDEAEVRAALAEAVAICRRVSDAIESYHDPIEQAGRAIRPGDVLCRAAAATETSWRAFTSACDASWTRRKKAGPA